ncbi:wall-associated receptor kinase-like 14 [Spinacia oleracea]|uniref:Wall-associated receptor kinase-like 14 n=1 Tax=Spinacia oleracea TaxID=3562 RepID=A0A9R0IEP8_SPIOL|nr:wall-associated receptor kinase-like 14 [Spinacia oleracea]
MKKKKMLIYGMIYRLSFFLGFMLSLTEAISTTNCSRSCHGNSVNFPFGFSENCEFRLDCKSDGRMEFKGFHIRNLTWNSILLNLIPNCSRPISQIRQLFGRNFALTAQNGLLLQNCSTPLNGCIIPASLVESRFTRCDGRRENMSCYATENPTVGGGILRYEDVNNTGCKFLFSSIVVDDFDTGNGVSDAGGGVSDAFLEFQTVQVGWWLPGTCLCDRNANCSNVGAAGYRCRCNQGFSGDGFVNGEGCHNVSAAAAIGPVSKQNGGAKIPVLIGGIIAGAVSMTILATICYFCRRRSAHLKSRTSARRLLSDANGNTPVPLYPYREIERATNGFSDKQRLGTGAYGTVYAGRLHNNDYVAIKKLKHRDTDSTEQVMNEIKLLSSVSHPNLVRLLGCCIEDGEQILVYEYMANGTLSEHLQRERESGKALPWTVRLTIASETAQAISYLHSAIHPPIYHRDIKSSNILLDFDYKSKVADFGLSRLGLMELSHISTAPQGTPGYVDPQYHQNFHLSDKSDVYSFGVVLIEIITAMKVVDFNRPHTEINLAALAVDRIGKGRIDEMIDPYLELHRDAWTLASVHKVAELAFRCLAYHRDMRPSMMEVSHELEQIRQSGWNSQEENMFMASSTVASSCSSPFNGSDRSFGGLSMKKVMGSQRVVVPQKGIDHLASLEEGKDCSPVSVHDPWFSEQSSPSTNSLLGHVIQ